MPSFGSALPVMAAFWLSIRDPNAVGVDLTYDPRGRNSSRTDTVGDTTSTLYDRVGNAIRQTDGKGNHTYIMFDARGRQASITDRISAQTIFDYTANGQLASLTDGEAQTTSYTYDALGNKLTETYPDHVAGSTVGQPGYGRIIYAYDNAGRVISEQDQKGDVHNYEYAFTGNMSIRRGVWLHYDRANRMFGVNEMIAGSCPVSWEYDAAGRKISEAAHINGKTYQIVADYNKRNEITRFVYPGGYAVSRTYHPRGELHQVTLTEPYPNVVVDTRTYDTGGRLASSSYHNGVNETRSYNADNTLASISFAGANIGNLAYTWDDNKNKTSESITGTMSNYGFSIPGGGYDNEDRLVNYQRTTGLTQLWNLSSVGDWNSITTNGTQQARTHGPTHELLTGAGQAVTTDVKGNITLIPAALRPDGQSLSLNWSKANKLISADVGANSSIDVSYQYDALGRRVSRTDSSGTNIFLHWGDQVFAEYLPNDNMQDYPTYRYVYGSYIDEPIVRVQKFWNGGYDYKYYHRNQQYSIYAITNQSGQVVERYAYTAYGSPTFFDGAGTQIANSSIANHITYTGREWEQALQQYYFRARMYDPELGRFSSRDYLGYMDGMILHQFVRGMPLSRQDPSGLISGRCSAFLFACPKKWARWPIPAPDSDCAWANPACRDFCISRGYNGGNVTSGSCVKRTRVCTPRCGYKLLLTPCTEIANFPSKCDCIGNKWTCDCPDIDGCAVIKSSEALGGLLPPITPCQCIYGCTTSDGEPYYTPPRNGTWNPPAETTQTFPAPPFPG